MRLLLRSPDDHLTASPRVFLDPHGEVVPHVDAQVLAHVLGDRHTAADAGLWQRLEPLLEAGGLRPPVISELAQGTDLSRDAVEKFLIRAERLIRALAAHGAIADDPQ